MKSDVFGVETDGVRVEATGWLGWLGVMEAGGAATEFGRSEMLEAVRDIDGGAC